MPEECLEHLIRMWNLIMKTSFLTLDEAVELLLNEIEKLIDHEGNEAKRRKLLNLTRLVSSISYVAGGTLEVVLRFLPGIMLSAVEAMHDESGDLRGLLITELLDPSGSIELLEEELAESIEDSQ